MQIDDLKIILKVAEFKSITKAATSLDMRTATASAAIKRVEAALGVDLFIRTTRHLRLSSAGERYIPECEKALAVLEQAKQHMHDDLAIVDGELRIALSSDLGRNFATQWLDQFTQAHPKVSLKIHISDSNIDFYRDTIDIALRYGSPTDASLYGFKICDVPSLLVASPEYLESHQEPQHPHDLASHNGLFYQLHDVVHDLWSFKKDEQVYKVKMSGNRASNDGDLVRRWCIAGHGVAVKSCLDMSNDLLENRAVAIMQAYQARSTELWLVCPSRQSITPAVRLLRDAFKDHCAKILSKLAKQGII